MEVNQIIDNLIEDLEHAELKNPHIHGDCNLTHFSHCFKYVGDRDGLWLEFGVFKGASISTIADCNPDKTIWGFDGFEGLPEHWNDENPKGTFSLGGKIPEKVYRGPNVIHGSQYRDWPENVKLIKGWFEDTLPSFVQENPGHVSFLHVDSDLYSSAKTIFKWLGDRIVPGTVICFDDWCGYPEAEDREHEIKAFAEFLIESGRDYKALSFQTYPTCSQAGFLIC